MTAIMQKIVEEVLRLDPAEQEELRAQLDRLQPDRVVSSHDLEYRQRLLDSGLLTNLPRAQRAEEPEIAPVEIKGKPVSETILEERR